MFPQHVMHDISNLRHLTIFDVETGVRASVKANTSIGIKAKVLK